MVTSSSPSSATILATATGWVHVGLARLAGLALVRFAGELVGLGDQAVGSLGWCSRNAAIERRDLERRRRAVPAPRQHPIDGGHFRGVLLSLESSPHGASGVA